MIAMVEARSIVLQFPERRALDGLTLTVNEGETYGLIGPNGAGKTTLIRAIAGLIAPTGGTLTVLGQPMPSRKIVASIGYMTQLEALYNDLTVAENLRFFATLFGVPKPTQRERMAELLALVNLSDRVDSVVGTLSGGMKQRVSLAVALIHKPRLALLDEPTVGIDPELRLAFWEYFARLAADGTTLIVSTHHLDEAVRCDRLGMVRDGKTIAEDTPQHLMEATQAATLEEAFLHITRRSNEL
ncbi:MAG: ABC transporter ATP-binding protein [Thermomicrobia bacterium]|nr:ABC transporter ATP-binding protein [Thermomicrobia bacterium]